MIYPKFHSKPCYYIYIFDRFDNNLLSIFAEKGRTHTGGLLCYSGEKCVHVHSLSPLVPYTGNKEHTLYAPFPQSSESERSNTVEMFGTSVAGISPIISILAMTSYPGDVAAVWEVRLADGLHTVQFEHGTTSGKRVITVDGVEVCLGYVSSCRTVSWANCIGLQLGCQ